MRLAGDATGSPHIPFRQVPTLISREHPDNGVVELHVDKRPLVLVPGQIDRRAAALPAGPATRDEPLHLCAGTCAGGEPIAKGRVTRQSRIEASGRHLL